MQVAGSLPIHEWKPILEDDAAERALEAVQAISRNLSPSFEAEPWWEAALLFGYLDKFDPGGEASAAVSELFKEGISCASALGSPGVQGLSGLGWTIQHLFRISDEPLETGSVEEDDPKGIKQVLQAIDSKLTDALQCDTWPGAYDLDTGLSGSGAYFLERMDSANARRALEMVVDHLERNADRSALGVSWRTDPSYLGIREPEFQAGSYCGLGLFQGVPGIVQFLGECWAAGIRCRTCENLLEGAIRWLFAQAQPPEGVSRFGPWSLDNRSPVGSRLAWCHGDLGISAVLFQVARRLDRQDLHDVAESLLERCLDWPADISGVVDATLCHGSAGVAHVFNRIYQTEGYSRCREAAVTWFDWTLSTMLPSVGTCAPSLRVGSTGVALALMAAATSVAPEWDRLMLLSGRFPTRVTWR